MLFLDGAYSGRDNYACIRLSVARFAEHAGPTTGQAYYAENEHDYTGSADEEGDIGDRLHCPRHDAHRKCDDNTENVAENTLGFVIHLFILRSVKR